jgi:hypothetical protein
VARGWCQAWLQGTELTGGGVIDGRQLSGGEAVVLQRQGALTAVCSDLGCSYSSTQEGREGRL